jgi:YegS/Rv2252/BmrU family lipid kinase
MASRYLVILNPRSGGGAARRAWPALERELRSGGAEVELALTRERGHAEALARDAAGAEWSAVIAAGGDGTVHEVANGLLSAGTSSPPPMGMLPCGSGNDFALIAGIPRDRAEAARRIVGGSTRQVDVGRVGERWFTNGVGIGLDARVAIEANRHRRLRGRAIYLWALARVLGGFSPPRMRVEIDGAEVIERPLTLISLSNGARHGGAFWLCPAARIDDGLLDLCICDGLGRRQILGFLPRTLKGTHVGASCVHMRTASRVRISSDMPLPVHADGEILHESAHELEIEIRPGALRLIGVQRRSDLSSASLYGWE